ncbi:YegP family protein [Streptomyces erythrochromogenes]|uniref:YegP family protein n=1 Tax=Streptomyces erythrochromogenes TaxID=285574 RepID=UPI003693E972
MDISTRRAVIAAHFEVRHQPAEGYHSVLIATTGQVIAISQHYETHRSCVDGIDSVKRNAGAPVQDTTGSTGKSS